MADVDLLKICFRDLEVFQKRHYTSAHSSIIFKYKLGVYYVPAFGDVHPISVWKSGIPNIAWICGDSIFNPFPPSGKLNFSQKPSIFNLAWNAGSSHLRSNACIGNVGPVKDQLGTFFRGLYAGTNGKSTLGAANFAEGQPISEWKAGIPNIALICGDSICNPFPPSGNSNVLQKSGLFKLAWNMGSSHLRSNACGGKPAETAGKDADAVGDDKPV